MTSNHRRQRLWDRITLRSGTYHAVGNSLCCEPRIFVTISNFSMALTTALPILGSRTYLRGFEMSADDANNDHEKSLVPLRREALLPNERGRGLGTVAVVCTMAGVASGLALATTLMAMQVADSMSMRTCPYRVVTTELVQPTDPNQMAAHGFLGIRYGFHDGFADIDRVIAGTPAAAVGLRHGDHLIAIDGVRVHSSDDLQERIYGAHPGASPTLTIERDGVEESVTPTLISWPVASY